ncbi:MAG: MFS transporter, partial [Bacteroidales bacterium]|nr:MFS transporter [Bacteroidales bacterium]
DAFYIVLFQVLVSSLIMKMKPLHSMITGILICAIGIGLTVATVNPFFMIVSVFIFALGEMMSSPKVSEYVGRTAPKEKVALYMGFSFFPLFIGNIVSGVLSGPVYEKISDKYYLLSLELQKAHIQLDVPPEGIRSVSYFQSAADALGLSTNQLRDQLYSSYHPDSIWMIFTGIGLLAGILLILYNHFLVKPRS